MNQTENQSQSTIYMSYETYSYLVSLISKELNRIENEFQIACSYVSTESYPDGSTGIDGAHKIFIKKHTKLRMIQDELHDSVQSSYKSHPNPDMRKFWGIKE